DALLHFIDADCELRTADAPAQARRIFAKPGLGMVGGLVLNANGSQYIFNYSPRISWLWLWSKRIHKKLTTIAFIHPVRYEWIRRALKWPLKHWPNILVKQTAKEVFCVAESNMLIS